jgi:hypothetical protein
MTSTAGQRKDLTQKTFELLQLAEDEYEDEYDDSFDDLGAAKGVDVRAEAEAPRPGASDLS